MPDRPPLPVAPSFSRAPRRWLAWLLGLLLLAALAGGSYWLVQRAQPGHGGRPLGPPGGPGGPGGPEGPGEPFFGSVTVGTALARAGELPVLVEALGTVTAPVTATLAPQVSGVLTQVLFTEGQMVQKGQVLARIDPRSYEQALAAARGQRLRDQAQLAAARVTLQRYQALWQQDSIARQELDTQAALVRQLEGVVAAGQASERAAEINLGFTTLRAPIDGRIGLRAVDPGNLVGNGGAGIATITQITPIDVLFAVTQERVPEVLAAERAAGRQALAVAALDQARTRVLAEGRFLTLDNHIDTATGTVRAKARFANADGALFPNQFVNVRLRLGARAGVLVPLMAVRTGPQGDYVYVVDAARTAHMRLVKRGMATDEQVLIDSGLQDGERVVTEGGDRVRDGGHVQLASEAGLLPPGPGASAARRARRDGPGQAGGGSRGDGPRPPRGPRPGGGQE